MPARLGISNTTMRITDEFGNTNNVTVTGNYMIGAGFNFELAAPNANYTISNVSFTNNYDGFRMVRPILPRHRQYATVTGITTVDFSNPTIQPRPSRPMSLLAPQRRLWSLRPRLGPAKPERCRQRS